jgi:hypothetical protein
VRRRRDLPALGIDAGKVDPLVKPPADPIFTSIGDEVRKAADVFVVAPAQPIASDYLHGALLAAIRQEPEKQPRRVIVALVGAFVERAADRQPESLS